jgi:D-methionine transport system permease protein
MNIAFLAGIDIGEINQAILDSLVMLGCSTLFASLIGIPLGILLYLTSKNGLLANKLIYFILSLIINILRSIPFIILLVLMIPLTSSLVGTSLGVKGVILPLIFGAFPFFARLIENSLKEISSNIIKMAKSFGASNWQIIYHILLPEILPNIIATITVTAITLVSYSAMAGAVGAGGLGDLAIRYGYQRFDSKIMTITVILMIIIVWLIQFLGDKTFRHLNHK